MGIFAKIITALRGGAREAGEAVVDANALRILRQEVHDAKQEISSARQGLAGLIASYEEAGAKIKELGDKIQKLESYATEALSKNDENLAREVAERIVAEEEERNYQIALHKDLEEKVKQQKEFIKSATRRIESLERDAKMVQNTEKVQKATAALDSTFSSSTSKVSKAVDSLERIKEKQKRAAAEAKAAKELDNELSGKDLEKRLAEAGIGESKEKAEDVLARLKAKSS